MPVQTGSPNPELPSEESTRRQVVGRFGALFVRSLETVLDPFAIFIPVQDTDGHNTDLEFAYANTPACEDLRMDREAFIGRRLLDVLPEYRSSGLFEMCCRTLDTGDPLVLDDFCYEGTWGDERMVRWLNIRITALNGALVHAWKDVTPAHVQKRALEDRVLQQTTINRLSRLVQSGADEAELLEEAVEGVAQALQVELANYLELVPGRHVFVLRAAVGWPESLVGVTTVPAGVRGSYADFVIAEGHPVSIEDMAAETRFNPSPLLTERGVVSGFSVVARGANGEAMGVLGAHSRSRRRFTKDEEATMQTLADVVSVGVLRHRSDTALVARTEDLASANKELEAFSYSVSHDLRAPLRAIHGFSKILEEGYAERLDTEGQRVLEVICANTEKMGQLIDDILALSRLGRRELQVTQIDMEGLAHSVADELVALEPGRDVQLHIGSLPEARGDPRLLRQVWTNLLSNALKFTGQKQQAEISIDGEDTRDGLTYHVRDNGVGFDMQYVEDVFEVFRSLHGSEFPGTGIGLAIVKRVIDRHGGTVAAEGRQGEGACFTFTLPHQIKET